MSWGERPNKGMHLTRSALATGTAALVGDPQCWADIEKERDAAAQHEAQQLEWPVGQRSRWADED